MTDGILASSSGDGNLKRLEFQVGEELCARFSLFKEENIEAYSCSPYYN